MSACPHDVIDRFIAATAPRYTPRTSRLYRYWLRRAAGDCGDLLVADPGAVADWLGSGGWSRNTMRSARNALRAFSAWAVSTGERRVDLAGQLPRVPAVKGVAHPTSEALYQRSLAAASPRDRLMLLLAGRCGLRRAEIAQLHSDDIDDQGLIVHGKGLKLRRVPLPLDVRAELEQRPRGWVFPGRWSGHMTPDSVGKAMRRALGYQSSGHACRHRFATTAYEHSRDIYGIKTAMGHASVETTEGYIAVSPAALLRVVEAAALVPLPHPRMNGESNVGTH